MMDIQEAAEKLKKGEIVAFPTETVYGLGAPIFYPEAIAKIFVAKGRPSDNPLIAHIAGIHDVLQIAVDIPVEFFLLYARFFPGPLTVILKKHPNVPAIVSGGMDTIAFRMPSHPVALQLIEAVGQPLVAPSANLSGKPSATEAAHVLNDFSGKIAGVIDGGPARFGLESTVVSLLTEMPVILRPGAISKGEIEEVLGKPVRYKESTDRVISPGMKYRHYAPEARVRLFFNEKELNQNLSEESVVLARHPLGKNHLLLSSETLYRSLREADKSGYREILVLCDREIVSNIALMNRLELAAAQPVMG